MSQANTRLSIDRTPHTVIVKHHDAVIASSKRALLVHGQRETPIYYLPAEDVYFEQMTSLGDAQVWPGQQAVMYSVMASGGALANAAWVLEDVPGEHSALAGHVGFDPDQLSLMTG